MPEVTIKCPQDSALREKVISAYSEWKPHVVVRFIDAEELLLHGVSAGGFTMSGPVGGKMVNHGANPDLDHDEATGVLEKISQSFKEQQ